MAIKLEESQFELIRLLIWETREYKKAHPREHLDCLMLEMWADMLLQTGKLSDADALTIIFGG